MESFTVDKSYFDIATSEDLKDLWAGEFDPAMQDVLRMSSAEGLVEWNLDKEIPGVILHDRLMTDAALGTRPIKSEHSYSMTSDGDSLPESPRSHSQKMDDMENECFPCIPMKTACTRLSTDSLSIKDEPMSETDSLHSSCPSSPHGSFLSNSDFQINIDLQGTQTLLKQSSLLVTSPLNMLPLHRKVGVKMESASFQLPPTPSPSGSSSEDSEDNAPISQPASPNPRKPSAARILLSHHTTTRQPIHTPLISTQPKGSTGSLILTEEEKRTLQAEGYPVPTRLPLTKAEEKSLKKIRRKIKNKISAQESRRKKKEYMDQLERKVEVLVQENTEYRKKIDNLQDSNTSLLSQLQKLQAIVSKTNPQLFKQIK